MGREVLLPEMKISHSISIGSVMEQGEVGLFITTYDVSASCAFSLEEWEKFVDGINQADQALKDIL